MAIAGLLWPFGRLASPSKERPDHPCCSSGEDAPVGMGCRPCAGGGGALGERVALVAAGAAPGAAGKVAPGVLGAEVMAGAGERGLDGDGRP
jgi:hypothetical protein